jgi:hypothetical protein
VAFENRDAVLLYIIDNRIEILPGCAIPLCVLVHRKMTWMAGLYTLQFLVAGQRWGIERTAHYDRDRYRFIRIERPEQSGFF